MRRREFIAALAGVTLVCPASIRAQQPVRPKLIGFALSTLEGDAEGQERVKALRQALQRLGWNEGSNIRLEFAWVGNDPERALVISKQLVELAPDLIVTSGTVATVALHKLTRTIPVVFVNVTDPVAGGLVASLSHPGGNMTGFTPFEYPIAGKWLERLREVAPRLARVALLGDPSNHNFLGFWRSFEAAAAGLRIKPVQVPARSAGEIEQGIVALAGEPDGGLIVTAAAFSLQHRDLIIGLAAKHRLPAIYWSRYFPHMGGLISYGPDTNQLVAQSAVYVDRILKGERPEDLPVQEASKFETVLNLKTAKSLDLAVSVQLMAQADEIIE